MRVVINLQDAVHGRAVLQGGGNIARNSPLPLQLEAQRTGLIGFDGVALRRSLSVFLAISGELLQPLADP